jgi:hypothetical protein
VPPWYSLSWWNSVYPAEPLSCPLPTGNGTKELGHGN